MILEFELSEVEITLPGLHTTDRKASVLRELRLENNLAPNKLPGVEAIGAGYNPFGKYASAGSITTQLFDWEKQATQPVSFNPKYVIPVQVDAQKQATASYSNTSGSSVNSFQSSLAARVEVGGSYNFFSGSITSEFEEAALQKSENEFSRIQQSISVWSLNLPWTAKLRDCMKPDIRDVLDSLPVPNPSKPEEVAAARARVEDFFNHYGSHFLSGIVMGGRAVLASATNKLQVDRSYSLEVTAQASYGFMTGQLDAKAQSKYAQAINSFSQTSTTSTYVVGGDGTLAAKAFGGKAGFDAWSASVGNSPDFVDFIRTIPMTEIWRLCKNQAQADFMLNYYKTKWAPEQSAKCQLYADYINQLVVITGSKANIQPPEGYTKLPDDLNADAGGDFIYLCYHKASYDAKKPLECIDSLVVLFGKEATPQGYTKLPQDLNKGVKGSTDVYLCYRSVTYNDKAAIKDIKVISGSNKDIPAPYGYTKIDRDLNAGAGGDFIYLCYSKDN